MKLEFKNDDYKVSCEIQKDLSYSQLSNVFEIIKNLIRQISNDPQAIDNIQPEMNKIAQKANIQQPTERPAFRDRLPNNIVDVSTLNVKQATQENALVRCPHCGQAHVLIIDNVYDGKCYMMRKKNNTFGIISTWPANPTTLNTVFKAPEMSPIDYYNGLQDIKDLTDQDFICDDENTIICPVCGEEDKFSEWKKAYNEPLNYFEYENICDVCGGEVLEKITKGKIISKCETCGNEISKGLHE